MPASRVIYTGRPFAAAHATMGSAREELIAIQKRLVEEALAEVDFSALSGEPSRN